MSIMITCYLFLFYKIKLYIYIYCYNKYCFFFFLKLLRWINKDNNKSPLSWLNYRDTGTSTILGILSSINRTNYLLFIEMIDWHWHQLFLLHPISIKYKYEIVSQEMISFNEPIIFWLFDLFSTQIFRQS